MSFPAFLSLPGALTFLGADTGTSVSSITITPGASSTQSAPVELSAALPYDVSEVLLGIQAGTQRCTIQFMLGTAGSEVAVSSEVVIGHVVSAQRHTRFIRLPIALPRGARLSARLRGNASSPVEARFQLGLMPSSGRTPQGFSSSWTVGFSTTGTQPTILAWGGAANTYGTPTEITASTPARANSLLITSGSLNGTNDAATLQIAIDPSGTPTFPPVAPIGGAEIIIPRGNELFSLTLPCAIPAGSRIWARYKSTLTTNPSLSLSLTGFY